MFQAIPNKNLGGKLPNLAMVSPPGEPLVPVAGSVEYGVKIKKKYAHRGSVDFPQTRIHTHKIQSCWKRKLSTRHSSFSGQSCSYYRSSIKSLHLSCIRLISFKLLGFSYFMSRIFFQPPDSSIFLSHSLAVKSDRLRQIETLMPT